MAPGREAYNARHFRAFAVCLSESGNSAGNLRQDLSMNMRRILIQTAVECSYSSTNAHTSPPRNPRRIAAASPSIRGGDRRLPISAHGMIGRILLWLAMAVLMIVAIAMIFTFVPLPR